MMNSRAIQTCLAMAAIHVLSMPSAWATSLPASMRYESLLESPFIDRLSVGAAYRRMHRQARFKDRLTGRQSTEAFKTEGGDIYIGWDTAPWLTAFATIGASKIRADGFSSRTKWSLGAGANIWHYELQAPAFMAGRLTIKTLIEYASHDSRQALGPVRVQWDQLDAVLTFGYEIVEKRLHSPDTMSLNLFAGPIVSFLDGDIREPGVRTDVAQQSAGGAVAGLEVKLTEHLTFYIVGTSYSSSGDRNLSTWTAGSRFHF